MKAIVCEAFGPVSSLVYKDVDAPVPKKGEVLVKIAASGVNFPDSLIVQGLYQIKPPTPFIPGGEVAGEVIAVGEGVPHLTPGRRVIAMCMQGGYAEQVCAPANRVMPIPDGLDYKEAAALVTAHATAHHALKQRALLQANETLVVTGAAGGTGLAAVQIGKHMGARVIAVCSSAEKCETARQNGAQDTINSSEQDVKEAIKSLTEGKGADVIYECVGGDMFHACSRSMAWKGRLLVIGFAGGEIPKFPVNLALVKGYSVVGVFWGAFTQKEPELFMQNMQELMTWYMQGHVKVVIDTAFALKNAKDALAHVTSRKVKGKVVIVP